MIRVAARRGGIAFALVLAFLAYAACSSAPTGTVTAALLVESPGNPPTWYVDVTLEGGGNGYELLEKAVEGDLTAEWFEQYGSHLVTGIGGVEPTGDAFWGVFSWNESAGGWEPLTVGADQWNVEEGQVMAWAVVTFDPDNPQLPQSPGIPPR